MLSLLRHTFILIKSVNILAGWENFSCKLKEKKKTFTLEIISVLEESLSLRFSQLQVCCLKLAYLSQYYSKSCLWVVFKSLASFIWYSTAKLAAGQQKHLLFEVQPGSDATALWKVAVRVVCTKVRISFYITLITMRGQIIKCIA